MTTKTAEPQRHRVENLLCVSVVDEDCDPLAAARGMVLGVLFGALIWAVILFALWVGLS